MQRAEGGVAGTHGRLVEEVGVFVELELGVVFEETVYNVGVGSIDLVL